MNETENTQDEYIDVTIDNYDKSEEKDVVIDDLETIRFESVPEKKQTQTLTPIIDECSVFGWLFMCFI
jgi:hypothetical protein